MTSPRSLVILAASLALLGACAIDHAVSPTTEPATGRAGKTATPTDPTATFYFPVADAALGLRSDHDFLAVGGDSSAYANGVCGVDAKLFATTAASNSGDAIMQTDNPQYADRKCTKYPRKLTVDYGDGVVQQSTVFINVRQVQSTTFVIPVGNSVKRGLHVNETRCGGLVWQAQLADGTSTNGADSVQVTRTSASTWVVQTQPAPNDKAYCKADGRLYHVPVQFTIVSSPALPLQ